MARKQPKPPHPITPDGHYFVVAGRLWRCSNPALAAEERATLVAELMTLRRKLQKRAGGTPAERAARRARLHAVKCALGERGAPWWGDEGPIVDRRRVDETVYADWYCEQVGRQRP